MRPGLLLALPVLLSLGTGACRPARPATTPPPAPATTSAATHRARGLVALDAGQFHLAREAFVASLAAAPDNLATRVLLDAATRALLASQQAAAEAFAAARPTVLLAPPAQAAVIREAPVTARGKAIRGLVQLRVDDGPRADDATWLRDHNFKLPELEVPNPMRGEPGDLPPGISPMYGTHVLVQAIAGPSHTLLFYGPDYRGGRFIAALGAAGERLAFFDLTAYERPATWAEVVDGVLLVTLGDDDGAYVVALELATGALLWRSDPGLASAANFVVEGAHLLTARGGASPAVFVLDRRTGAALTSHPLAGEPAYMLVHARRLSVRTDVADHEFELR